MSYEDPPPLDFTAFQMACICGNNGHGKSAVIDAITWALWGEGRKASIEKKPDEGLLKIGKTEMMVEFTFDMEGDRYRVIRQYSKSGKTAKTILEFEVFSSEKGEFTNLTQKNMSQTQEKIIEHLRMGYETFINSSVMLQGRADEFAIKKASERKQLLCDILGLSKYDELSMLAREKYKESNIRMEFVEEEKNRLEKELLEKENVEERLKNIKDDLQNLNKEIDNTEKELIVMREKKSTLSAIMNQIEGIEKQIVREESSIKDMKKQKIQLQEEMKLTEKILQEEEVILKNHNLYEELIKQDALMYEKNKKITSLKQKKMSTESKINQGKNELSSEINVIKEKINSIKVQLKETLKVIDLKEDIEDGFNKLKALENQEKEIEKKFKLQKNLEDLRIKLEKSISEKEGGLKIELATLHKREEEYDIQILKKENIIKQIETLKEEINHMETLEKEKERVILKGTEEQSKTTRMKEQIKEIEKKLEEERQKWMNISKSKDSNCPLCDAPFDEKRKKQTLGKIKKEGEAKKEEINRLVKEIETSKKETHSIKEEYKRLEGEIKKLHPKKSILAQKQVELENCNKASLLKEEIKAKMQKINKILEEKHYAGEEIKKQKEIEEKLILLDYSEEKVQNIKGEKEKWDKYRQEKIKLDIATENRDKLSLELPLLENTLKEKEEILTKEEFSLEFKKELQEITRELEELNFSQEEHNTIRDQLKKLNKIPTQMVYLNNAKKQYPLMVEKHKGLSDNLKEKEDLLITLINEKEHKTLLIEELPSLCEIIPQKESLLYGLRLRANDLTGEKGNLENMFEEHKKVEEILKKFEKEFEEKGKDREIYRILSKAFGKDGIQSLIIQNCIPEIETAANDILSRLTDNRIHIALELQRDKKSGGLKDTLDIKISDESGTRDYELYSGGEAFRTNFSLRVALAKLMARRSGTKLRTLIIDEGFGTQDSEGIEQLVEALQEISKDFDKILVITHMESLKNMFPTRIEVTKSPTYGSVFKVIG